MPEPLIDADAPDLRYFYVSRLAPGQPTTVVADVLRVSRAFNRAHGISGALLFDGEHFAQFLEGPVGHVAPLAARIEADPRHVEVDVRLRVQGRFPRLFTGWRCGWVELDLIAHTLGDGGASAADLVGAFRGIAETSDIA